MRSLYFTLEGRQVVPCSGPEELDAKLASPEWCVAKTQVGDRTVVTVFLGMDWNYGRGKPVLFETVVLNGCTDHGLFHRYATWEAAEAGHCRAVLAARRRVVYN